MLAHAKEDRNGLTGCVGGDAQAGMRLLHAQQGGDDHARGCAAAAHLAVEYQRCPLRRIPQPLQQNGEVRLLWRLLIGHGHAQVVDVVPLLCSGQSLW